VNFHLPTDRICLVSFLLVASQTLQRQFKCGLLSQGKVLLFALSGMLAFPPLLQPLLYPGDEHILETSLAKTWLFFS